jgi:hypothetical protein
MIRAKREKERWKMVINEAFVCVFYLSTHFTSNRQYDVQEWQETLRRRPILTGGYLRPTLSNRPLPRLKPQPMAISGMIYKRRVARDRRMTATLRLREWRDDLFREHVFESKLQKSSPEMVDRVFADHNGWGASFPFIVYPFHQFSLKQCVCRTAHTYHSR